jgi:Na+/proline symporter
MGGITTVIWTDVVQFTVFTFGALFSIAWLFNIIPETIGEMLSLADHHAKLVLFDISTDPHKAYTLWAGLIGFSVLQLGQNAIDQVSTQRIMCCGTVEEARKSVIFASIGSISTLLMLVVGLLLWSHYFYVPPSQETAALLAAEPDRVLPHFIVTELPVGVSGIIIAALFAAGISTLDSALAALSQTFVFGVYRPLFNRTAGEQHYLAVSRIAIVMSAVILCSIAIVFYFLPNEGLLNLGLKVPGYVYGPLLGIALLALMRRGSTWSIFSAVAVAGIVILVMQSANIAFFWWYPISTCVVVGVVLVIDGKRKQNQ